MLQSQLQLPPVPHIILLQGGGEQGEQVGFRQHPQRMRGDRLDDSGGGGGFGGLEAAGRTAAQAKPQAPTAGPGNQPLQAAQK
jgi:hypothetical protein